MKIQGINKRIKILFLLPNFNNDNNEKSRELRNNKNSIFTY